MWQFSYSYFMGIPYEVKEVVFVPSLLKWAEIYKMN